MCLMLKPPHTQAAVSCTGFLRCLLSLQCPGVLPHDLQTPRLCPCGLACCSNISHSFQPPLSSCQHFVPPLGQGGVLNNLHYNYLIVSWKGESGEPWPDCSVGWRSRWREFWKQADWAWILASPIGEVVFNLASYFNSLSLSFLHYKMMRKIPTS